MDGYVAVEYYCYRGNFHFTVGKPVPRGGILKYNGRISRQKSRIEREFIEI
jgi:hypothetical protein